MWQIATFIRHILANENILLDNADLVYVEIDEFNSAFCSDGHKIKKNLVERPKCDVVGQEWASSGRE
jgi:hypothetical protein